MKIVGSSTRPAGHLAAKKLSALVGIALVRSHPLFTQWREECVLGLDLPC